MEMEESSLSAKLKNYKAEESGTNYARLFLQNSSDTFRERKIILGRQVEKEKMISRYS